MRIQNTPSAQTVLRQKNWLPQGVDVKSVDIAGAGNMNLVERVRLSNGSSLILKRSRGWVEKYPDIPAPVERASIEAAFYKRVRGTPAGDAMPELLQHNPSDATSLFEDLGEGKDGSFVYSGWTLPKDDLSAVANWAASLHAIPVTDDMRGQFENKAMRALNGLHIFDFPLDPTTGFDLDAITPGLQVVGDKLKHDMDFVTAVKSVGERYQNGEAQAGDVLLHGDLYPGSWLTTENGLFVIDPEFCWIGPPEWDIGMLIAHLRLSDQPTDYETHLITQYGRELDAVLLNQIAGIEMMRRLIGVAQLPLDVDLARKTALLDEAYTRVMGSPA